MHSSCCMIGLCTVTVVFALFFLASGSASLHDTNPVLLFVFVCKVYKNLYLKEAAQLITEGQSLHLDVNMTPRVVGE